ncbi:MAG: hypothetical protein ABR977_10765 [Candidatus Dormibacteria bacterium]|jgi:hypothetical protein
MAGDGQKWITTLPAAHPGELERRAVTARPGWTPMVDAVCSGVHHRFEVATTRLG